MADPVSLREVPTAAADPVFHLRNLADKLEAGEFGPIRAVAVVVLGDQLDAFGYGQDGEPGMISRMLQRANHRIVMGLE